jgi:hypothetical protein
MNNLSEIQTKDIQLYNTKAKWYIRKNWLESAKKRRDLVDNDFIKYFTLTCTMAYDVIYFTENDLIPKSEIKFDPKYLMFCERNSHRHTLIRNKLTGAQENNGPVENFLGAGERHIPGKIDKTFPFDVVNLDINVAPFNENSKLFLISYNAFEKLFFIQRGHSFNFFLTFKVHQEWDHQDKIQQIQEILNTNRQNADYNAIYTQIYNENELEYIELLLLMIPKLIIRTGYPFFDVTCAKKFRYIGGDDTSIMVSFIFECESIADGDQNNDQKLVRLNQALQLETENVDEILNSNNDISTECEELVSRFSS